MEEARITIPTKKDRQLKQITDSMWAVKGTYSGRLDFFEPSPLYTSPSKAGRVVIAGATKKAARKLPVSHLPKRSRTR